MKHTKFVVSSFENRNGTTSWRVGGYFNEVRIRNKAGYESRKVRADIQVGPLHPFISIHDYGKCRP